MAQIEPFGVGAQMAIKLMNNRIGRLQVPPHFYRDTVTNANLMATELEARGGFPQQERMVRDRRKALDHATKYSYQAARIRKVQNKDEVHLCEVEQPLVRALINPNKLKMDYDEKIVSVGFEYGFQTGDIFEWARTNSHWIIINGGSNG